MSKQYQYVFPERPTEVRGFAAQGYRLVGIAPGYTSAHGNTMFTTYVMEREVADEAELASDLRQQYGANIVNSAVKQQGY